MLMLRCYGISDWKYLLNSCQAAYDIRAIIQQLADSGVDWKPGSFDDMLQNWDPKLLDHCIRLIDSTIDIKESKLQGRFVAKAGCHGQLDELKHHCESP